MTTADYEKDLYTDLAYDFLILIATILARYLYIPALRTIRSVSQHVFLYFQYSYLFPIARRYTTTAKVPLVTVEGPEAALESRQHAYWVVVKYSCWDSYVVDGNRY